MRPGDAFYLVLPRAWELLTGSLLAIWLHRGEATLTFPQTLVLRYTRLEPKERRNPQVAEDYAKWFAARLRAVFHNPWAMAWGKPNSLAVRALRWMGL